MSFMIPLLLNAGDDSITSSRRNAITRAVEKCSPAIVSVNVTEVIRQVDPMYGGMDPFFMQFFGDRGREMFTREYQVRELGSGFLISDDGYILTNNHVAGNAKKIIVTTTDGKKYDADIIGSDVVSDVALIKIKGDDFQYLKLGNSDDAIIGEWAIALGNPFGLFDLNSKPTITVGVVSNKGVSFMQENRVYKNMIQTDAAISSGNSGGPLVNSNGEVIGMNTVIFSTAQSNQGAGSIGIGFAIPINRVKEIIKILKSDGSVDRNFYMGLDVKIINEKIAKYYKLSQKEGLVVYSVDRNSDAYNAGIEPRDIILAINGKPVLSLDDYSMSVGDGIVGHKLEFTILRDDMEQKKVVTLTARKRKR